MFSHFIIILQGYNLITIHTYVLLSRFYINFTKKIPIICITYIFETAIMYKDEDIDEVEYFLSFWLDEIFRELIEGCPDRSVFAETPLEVEPVLCLFPKMHILKIYMV